MAGRGGAGVGIVVTISILSIVCLALFISTVIFYGNLNKVRGELASSQQSLSAYVSAQERQDPNIALLEEAARRNQRTVVGYLHDSLERTMSTIDGSARGTVDDQLGRLDKVELSGIAKATGWTAAQEGQTPPSLNDLLTGGSFAQLLRRVDSHIQTLEDRIAAAEKAKAVAEADLANELERSRAQLAAHQATLATVNQELENYRAEVQAYREGTDQARQNMESRVTTIQQQLAQRETQLLDTVTSLEEETQRLQNQLDVLRGERKQDLFQGRPEESLVDGRVISVDPAEGTATINLGRNDKIRVGLTFSVYEEPSAVRPNEAGDYPRGKASLEIIRIDETSATARVLAERSGNPVVRGDVIANAVYDPNKTYKFLVVGNFDANRDGIATEAERASLAATIQDWGGVVTDELAGDVDFLVLGARPTLPPEPPIDAPIPVVEQFVQAQQVISRYDRLFQQAAATSIPVLNENRLRTLIGAY